MAQNLYELAKKVRAQQGIPDSAWEEEQAKVAVAKDDVRSMLERQHTSRHRLVVDLRATADNVEREIKMDDPPLGRLNQ